MSYFYISFKNSFVYRSNVIFSIIGSIFTMLIQIALWVFVYHNDSEQVNYMVTYVILSTIIGLFYSNGMSNIISSKVNSGAFSIDLIRPVNFIAINYYNLLGQLCASFIIKGLPIKRNQRNKSY